MKKVFFIFAILLFFADISSAQNWVQTNGPGGDHISSIAVNSHGDIFIASRRLDRSTDGGKTWVHILPSLPIWKIGKVAVQPSGRVIISIQHKANGNTDYTQDSILVSDNNGDNWKTLPINTGYYWQGASGMLFAQDINSYVRSSDDGNTWSPLTLNGVTGNVVSIFSDKAGHLFVCAQFLYRSLDNGISWSKVINGLSDLASPITSIRLASNNKLLAVAEGTVCNLLRSEDSGRTWTPKLPLNENDLYAFSNDSIGNLFFLDFGGGIHTSSNNGDTWDYMAAQPGINFRGNGAICSATESVRHFLFSVANKFFRYTPSAPPESIDVANASIESIAVYPDSNLISFNAYDPNQQNDPDGLFWYSSNQGNNWLQSASVSSTSIVKTSAAVVDSSKYFLAGFGGSIIASVDAGKTWKTKFKNLTNSLISGMVVRFNGDIFATSSTEGVFRSTDQGLSWDQMNSGLSDLKLYSVAVRSNGVLYVGGQNFKYKSIDNGESWHQLTGDSIQRKVNYMVVSPEGNIFALMSGRIFRSSDDGSTWSVITIGMHAKVINTLLMTPDRTVFAATDSGVFSLDPGSNAWLPFSIGLTTKNILSLTYNSEGRLFAGSDGSGVFKSLQTFNVSHGLIGWIDADDIDFDSVAVGSEVCKDMFIRNVGAAPYTLSKSFFVKDKIPFSVDTQSILLPYTLQPNTSVKVRVCFHPPQIGSYSSEIDWSTDIDASVSGSMKFASFLHGIAFAKSAVAITQASPKFSLNPNPVSGNLLKVSFSEALSQSTVISVFDVLGREVYHTGLAIGQKEFDLPIRELAEGMYYVRIETDGEITTKQFVKVK